MGTKASITVVLPKDEVQRLWHDSQHPPDGADATVSFADAPGDRGTEIHVELSERAPAGKLGEAVQKLTGSEPLAKVKDDLRRFKQQVETGEVARSEAAPGGELLETKPKGRPAQPLADAELERARG